MNRVLVLSLTLLVVFYGMPVVVNAQMIRVFDLPDGISGQAYGANIQRVLLEKYRLTLETDASAAPFRWAFIGGEMPPGLILRTNGIIVGKPRVSRDDPYQFQVKVFNPAIPDLEPLHLSFTIAIARPKVRIINIKSPNLVPVTRITEPDQRSLESSAQITLSSDAEDTPQHSKVSLPGIGLKLPYNNSLINKNYSAANIETSFLRHSSFDAASTTPAINYTNVGAASPNPVPTPACDQTLIPTGSNVFRLDSRNGNLTNTNGTLVSKRQRFDKKQQVTIIVDNKNPYLYTYKYSSTITPVTESAINAFVPFIVGSLGELAKTPTQPAEPTTAKVSVPAPGPEKAAPRPTPACQPAIDLTRQLIIDVKTAIGLAENLKTALEYEKLKSKILTSSFEAARLPLYSVNQPRETLCAASSNLVNVVDANVDAGTGIDSNTHKSASNKLDPIALDQIKSAIEAQIAMANEIKKRIQVIREAFPNCMNLETDKNKLLREHLREADENADKLSTNAANYRDVLEQIRTHLSVAVQGRQAVVSILNDQFAFYEVHVEGGYEETNAGPIQLEVTPRQGVTQAVVNASSPFKLHFTFGKAPFFSLSGGLIFSPLRKREFVRVQGFERDQNGNLVMVDGKPNLTTVVGLSENSPTRITPAIFLNGRLSDPKRDRFIDGIYLSLGITAKNDNKGTDVEFLLGPSISMFDRNMFFTFGGYAGRQQKLTGDLFEGFAVPSTVDELPIQKNYRWHFGFALSYRIPVND